MRNCNAIFDFKILLFYVFDDFVFFGIVTVRALFQEICSNSSVVCNIICFVNDRRTWLNGQFDVCLTRLVGQRDCLAMNRAGAASVLQLGVSTNIWSVGIKWFLRPKKDNSFRYPRASLLNLSVDVFKKKIVIIKKIPLVFQLQKSM